MMNVSVSSPCKQTKNFEQRHSRLQSRSQHTHTLTSSTVRGMHILYSFINMVSLRYVCVRCCLSRSRTVQCLFYLQTFVRSCISNNHAVYYSFLFNSVLAFSVSLCHFIHFLTLILPLSQSATSSVLPSSVLLIQQTLNEN